MNFHEAQMKKFEEKFSWIHCGNFKPTDGITRTCYKCGFLTEFCDNCNKDHHVERKETAIKSFLSHLLTAQLEKIEEGIKGMRKLPTEDQESGLEEEEEEEDEAYDQALTDVLDLISKLKEKS